MPAHQNIDILGNNEATGMNNETTVERECRLPTFTLGFLSSLQVTHL